MRVFPESMQRLNIGDVRNSLRTVEDYIEYMRERVEWAMGNTARTGSGGEIGGDAAIVIEELATAVSTLSSTVNLLQGDIARIAAAVGELDANTVKFRVIETNEE